MIYFMTHMSVKYIQSLLLVGVCITFLQSQDKMDIRDWIEGRRSLLSSSTGEIEGNAFKPSWIRELEFRTETEDFLIDKQEYLIRFRPTYPGERNAQSNLIKVSKEEWDINVLNFENDLNRYLLDELLVIRQVNEKISLLTELLQVYEDQKQLISDQLYSGKFNLKDLSQIDGDIRTIKSQINQHQLRVDILSQKNILPDTDQLLSIQNISQQLTQQDLLQQSSINTEERNFELRKVEAEIEMEKIEAGRIFDFIQLRYNGPHNDLLRERMAVGVNIQLPNNGRQKLSMEELRVEQLLRQQELDQQQLLDSIRLTGELDDFTLLIRQWDYNAAVIEQADSELKQLINKGINIEFENPDIILYEKEQLLKLRENQIELEGDIYQSYFDLLERTTILGENRFYSFIIRS